MDRENDDIDNDDRDDTVGASHPVRGSCDREGGSYPPIWIAIHLYGLPSTHEKPSTDVTNASRWSRSSSTVACRKSSQAAESSALPSW